MAQGDLLKAVMQSDIGSAASGGVAHQAVEPSLAAAFSATHTQPGGNAGYVVGEYCARSGVLYRCTTAHTGAWDASHFTAVSVGGDMADYLPTKLMPFRRIPTTDNIDNLDKTEMVYWAGADSKPLGSLPNVDGTTLSYCAMFHLRLLSNIAIQFALCPASNKIRIQIRKKWSSNWSAWEAVYETP